MPLLMTYDRGKEMAENKLFIEVTKMQVYFCDPHSTWQRGTYENANMLIRNFSLRRLILVNSPGRRSSMFRSS
jgi:IS30 family transposase